MAPRRAARSARLQVVAKSTKGGTSSSQVGFRFDAANNRWVRDDRFAGITNTMMVPKTGVAYTVWPAMHTLLMERGFKGVTPAKAAELQAAGWTLADVRVEADYVKQHAEGAISLPLFRYVQGSGFWDNLKKVTMAVGFAMAATERDPDYVANCLRKVSKGQKLLLMCNIGGTLDTQVRLRPDKYPNGIKDADRSFGRESRSLKAAYELLLAGWSPSNLMFVEGGLAQWRFEGYPVESGPDPTPLK